MGIKEKEKTCRGQCGKQCAKAKQVRHASCDSHSTTDSSDGPKETTHKKGDRNVLSSKDRDSHKSPASKSIKILWNYKQNTFNNYGERGERDRQTNTTQISKMVTAITTNWNRQRDKHTVSEDRRATDIGSRRQRPTHHYSLITY